MPKPNVIINWPMTVDEYAAIARALPKGSVIVPTDDSTQSHIYFDPADAPRRESKGLRVQLEVADRDDDDA